MSRLGRSIVIGPKFVLLVCWSMLCCRSRSRNDCCALSADQPVNFGVQIQSSHSLLLYACVDLCRYRCFHHSRNTKRTTLIKMHQKHSISSSKHSLSIRQQSVVGQCSSNATASLAKQFFLGQACSCSLAVTALGHMSTQLHSVSESLAVQQIWTRMHCHCVAAACWLAQPPLDTILPVVAHHHSFRIAGHLQQSLQILEQLPASGRKAFAVCKSNRTWLSMQE